MAFKYSKKSSATAENVAPLEKKVLKRLSMDGVTEEPVIDYLDHAPVAPFVIFTDGLFQSLARGNPNSPLDVTTSRRLNSPHFVRFQCPQQLGVEEQTVLFYLCQRAMQPVTILLPSHAQAAEYAAALAISGYEFMPNIVGFRVRYSEIVAGVGLKPTGPNTQAIVARLNRLAQVTMSRFNTLGCDNPNTARTNLIGVLPRGAGEVAVLLNPESSACVATRSGIVWINMREQKLLASKPSRRLHAWLSGWAKTGEEPSKIRVESVVKHIWGAQECSRTLHNSRMEILRHAIKEIADLPGWHCHLHDGMVWVRKPLFVGMTKKDVLSRILQVETTNDLVVSLSD